jgi:hypothetical protein
VTAASNSGSISAAETAAGAGGPPPNAAARCPEAARRPSLPEQAGLGPEVAEDERGVDPRVRRHVTDAHGVVSLAREPALHRLRSAVRWHAGFSAWRRRGRDDRRIDPALRRFDVADAERLERLTLDLLAAVD